MPYRWRAAVLVALWLFSTLSSMIGVPILLPAISKEFNASIAATAWVSLAYYLAMASAFVPASHFGDVLGHKRVALWGSYLEVATMVVIVAVPSLAAIVVFRFVQGVVHSLSVPNFNAFAIGSFSPQDRGKALGFISAMTGSGWLVVPLAMGAVTDFAGWRWAFLGGGAIELVVTVVAHRVLAQPEVTQTRQRPGLKVFDLPGAALLMLAVVPFVVGIQMTRGADAVWAWPLIGVAVALGVLFVLHERNLEHATLLVRMFRHASFSVPSVYNLTFNFANGVSVYLVPVFLIQGLGWSATYAATVVMAQSAGRPVASVIGGYLSDRIGTQPVIQGGLVLLLVAILGLGLAGSSGSLPGLIPFMLLFGFAHNVVSISNQKQMYGVVSKDQLAMAPGIMGLGRHVGQGVGIGIAAAVFSSTLGSTVAGADAAGASTAFRVVMLITAVAFVAGSLAARFGPSVWGTFQGRRKGAEAREPVEPPAG